MFTIIVDAINNYTYQQIHKVLQGQDRFEQVPHNSYQRQPHLETWKDINAEDIKSFIVHLIVMSSVKNLLFTHTGQHVLY